MDWQDVAAALNKLEEWQAPPALRRRRDAMRAAAGWTVGVSTEADLPAAEVEHDTELWNHGVPPDLIGRAGMLRIPPDAAYQHVVGPVHPYLRFEPGPIGGEQP